jgi:hypothetical protein
VIIVFLTLLVIVIVCVATLPRLRPAAATVGAWAWRLALVTAALFVAAIGTYQKPASFYTNFVLFPSLVFFLIGLLLTVIAIPLGIVAAIRGDTARGLKAIGLALLSATTAWIVILWRAADR